MIEFPYRFNPPLELQRIIEEWEPRAAPHCSDCRNCRVMGTPDAPRVTCAAGHDGAASRDVWIVIRKRNPRGFRDARNCPDFDSMGGPD